MDELMGEFITETSETLAMLDFERSELARNPGGGTVIDAIYTLIHKIKGACGFLDLPRLDAIASAAEKRLSDIRASGAAVPPGEQALIFSTLDTIKAITDHLAEDASEPVGDDSALIARLQGPAEPEPEPIEEIVAQPEPEPEPLEVMAPEPEPIEIVAATEPEPVIFEEAPPEIAMPPLEPEPPELLIEAVYAAELPVPIEIAEPQEPEVETGEKPAAIEPGVLENWMQMVGELVLTRNQLMQIVQSRNDATLRAPLRALAQITDELKDDVIRTRMQAIGEAWEHMPARMRAAGKSIGKTIELNIVGGETELDRELLTRLREPMQLILRHIAEHGPEKTNINLIASHQGGYAMIDIQSNARGLRADMFDDAHDAIEALGAELSFGATANIRIPLDLAIVPAVMVEAAGIRYALTQSNVRELVEAGTPDYPIETINTTQLLRLRGRLVPLAYLRGLLGLPELVRDDKLMTIAVLNVTGRELGLVIDNAHDIEEIVVRPVPPLLQSIPLYAGNAVSAQGGVTMLLDARRILREVGEVAAPVKEAMEQAVADAPPEHTETFLLFRSGPGALKAVPLELIARVEQIDATRIEYAERTPVIQYQGELMRLKTLSGTPMPKQGNATVIVFTYDNRALGLIVDTIIDVASAPVTVKMSSDDEEYVGSMVMLGKVTDVVDVNRLLKKLVDEATPPAPNTPRGARVRP